MVKFPLPGRFLALAVAAAALAGTTWSRPGPARPVAVEREHPVEWSIVSVPKTVVQGKEFDVVLQATIPTGWHLYSMTQPPPIHAMSFTVQDRGKPFMLARTMVIREPEILEDKVAGMPTESYIDSLTAPMKLLAKEAGKAELRIVIHYQTCNDTYCLPPFDDTVRAPITVTPGTVDTAVIAAAPPEPPVDSLTTLPTPTPATPAGSAPFAGDPSGGATGGSLLLFLGFAALMGAISLLTPCVFPMVPITVSYFTQRGAVSRGAAVRQAAIYAGGIMATFTVLGMAIAVLVGAGGINRFAANPWINLLVTGIFAAFALNLFGVFQMSLPSGLLTKLDGAARSETRGTVGSLLMGLTFTLTSFTCTAPLVGSLLVTASTGSWTWPLLGLLVYSAVFALPFFLLALLPSAVQRLPRSGAWLGTVKPVLGCIELAMAFKFLSNADLVLGWGIFTRDVVLWAWLILAVIIVVLLLDLIPRVRRRPAAAFSAPRGILAVATLALVVLLGRGIAGARVGELESFLPPREGRVVSGTTEVEGELPWIVNDYPAALAQAKAEGKAVLIDFTGYTCTNCRWMEANMFPRDEVVAELDQFVRVRLYTDGRGEPYVSQQAFEQQTFQTVALPLYAIMDPDGNPRGHLIGMRRDPADFIRFLADTRALAMDRVAAQ